VLSQLRQRLAATQRRRAIGPPPPPPPPWEIEAFLEAARRSFVGVQRAWDCGDLVALASFATEPLFRELRAQLAERGDAPNHTEVLHVEARLLNIENLCDAQIACVEFSGLIRERHDVPPLPFRELWMLARLHHALPELPDRPAEPSWRVARVQALG